MTDTYFASEADLLADDIKEATVEVQLPTGQLVLIRGLSRFELHLHGKIADGDSAEIERRNIAACLVVPKLTLDQVREWQKRTAAGGAFRQLSEHIRDLSGLGEGADKSDLRASGPESE